MRSTYSPNMPNRRNSKMRASREDSGVTASFIEPMLLQRSSELPDGPEWLRELEARRLPSRGFQIRRQNPSPLAQRCQASGQSLV